MIYLPSTSEHIKSWIHMSMLITTSAEKRPWDVPGFRWYVRFDLILGQNELRTAPFLVQKTRLALSIIDFPSTNKHAGVVLAPLTWSSSGAGGTTGLADNLPTSLARLGKTEEPTEGLLIMSGCLFITSWTLIPPSLSCQIDCSHCGRDKTVWSGF